MEFSDNFKAELIKRERKDIDFTSKNLYRKSSSENSAGKYLRKSKTIYDWADFEKYCECCGVEFTILNKTVFTICKTCDEQLQKDLNILDKSIRKKYGRKPHNSERVTTKMLKENTCHHSTISSFIESKRREVINYILRHQSCTIDDLYEMPIQEYEKLKNDIKANITN